MARSQSLDGQAKPLCAWKIINYSLDINKLKKHLKHCPSNELSIFLTEHHPITPLQTHTAQSAHHH